MSVQTIAARRAIRILDALGAKYNITLPDGTEYKKTRRNTDKVNDFTVTGYTEQVQKLKVGAAERIPFNGFAPEKLRSAIAARAIQTFGKASCITHIDRQDGHIEILRVK